MIDFVPFSYIKKKFETKSAKLLIFWNISFICNLLHYKIEFRKNCLKQKTGQFKFIFQDIAFIFIKKILWRKFLFFS